MAADVTTVDAGPRAVSRRVVVQAPAAEVFALAADPHRHHELDGSGTVRDTAVKGPHQLGVGERFTVGMKQYGVPYKITSEVTAYEQDKLVEWQHPAGHRWRWEFAPAGGGRDAGDGDLRLQHRQGAQADRPAGPAGQERRGDHGDTPGPGGSVRLRAAT